MLTPEQAYRRAGGRRRYNKERHSMIFWRLIELEQILRREGYQPGDYAKWAARLGVSRATICRDMQRLWNAHGSAVAASAAQRGRRARPPCEPIV